VKLWAKIKHGPANNGENAENTISNSTFNR